MSSAVLLSVSAVISVIATATAATELDVQWAGYTMSGALVAAAIAFCLGPMERGKIVLGRSLAAAFVGVIGPRVCGYFYSELKNFLSDPLLMLGAGFAFGAAGYLLALGVVQVLNRRERRIVEKKLDEWGLGDDMHEQPMPNNLRYAANPNNKHETTD